MSITFKENLNERDMTLVKELAKKDLENGHYKADLDKLYLQLERVNNKHIIDITPPPNHKTADAYLYLIKDFDEKIGFVMTVIRDSDLEKQVCEIYMMSLKEHCQNSGYGTKILQKISSKFGEEFTLFARCREESIGMKRLLKKNGFKLLSSDTESPVTEDFMKL